MSDFRTEIRAAFEKQQSAFPPPPALRAQVDAAVSSRVRADVPARQRAAWNMDWLLVAAAILVTIAIVAGFLAGRLTNWLPTLVKPGPAPKGCAPGPTEPLHGFDQVHGLITYANGSMLWAVDPNSPSTRISLGQEVGMTPVAWSRDGSRLLLSRQRSESQVNQDLYVMSADGSQTRLTCDGLSRQGSFSPDGAQVVFAQLDNGLYVIDAKGGTRRLIARSMGSWWLESPAWSPNGSRIAYMVYREFLLTYEIWTVKPDGTDQRMLVDLGTCGGGGCSGGLTWSPDGSRLAFYYMGGDPTRIPAIYVVKADGSGLLRLNDDGFQPSWSPDGSRIAFTRGNDLFTMAVSGGDVRDVGYVFVLPPNGTVWNPVPRVPTVARLAPQLCVAGAPPPSNQLAVAHGCITYAAASKIWAVDPNHPANRISLGASNGMTPITWSRDGNRLLLVGQTVAGMDLYVINANGSRPRLTSDGLSGEGTFSPDGTKVVYARADDGLYVVDANGGSRRLIAKSHLAWWLASPAWSPDGSRIAYMVYREGDPPLTYEIWTVKPDGTGPRLLVDLGECGGGGCSGGLTWSPDGSRLAFDSRRGSPTRTPAIYIVNADGSGLLRLNDDGAQPSWSPDGSRIAFTRGNGLFTMAVDGSDVRQVDGVVLGPPYATLAWNPAR